MSSYFGNLDKPRMVFKSRFVRCNLRLEGLARILKIKIIKDSQEPEDFVHPQDQIVAETLVLWASSLSFHYSDIDCVGNAINWDDLSPYLVPYRSLY